MWYFGSVDISSKLTIYLTLLLSLLTTTEGRTAVGTTQRLTISAREVSLPNQTVCSYNLPTCVKDGTCFGHVGVKFVPTRKSRLFAEVRMGHKRGVAMDDAGLQVWVVTKGLSGMARSEDIALIAPGDKNFACITVTFVPHPESQLMSIEIRDSDSNINPDYAPILLYENTYVVTGMTSVFRPVIKTSVILEHPVDTTVDDLTIQAFHSWPWLRYRGESENGLSSCIPFVEGDPMTQILTMRPLGLCSHDQVPLGVQ